MYIYTTKLILKFILVVLRTEPRVLVQAKHVLDVNHQLHYLHRQFYMPMLLKHNYEKLLYDVGKQLIIKTIHWAQGVAQCKSACLACIRPWVCCPSNHTKQK